MNLFFLNLCASPLRKSKCTFHQLVRCKVKFRAVWHKGNSLLVPARLRSGNNVGGDIGNVIIRKTPTERRHGILAVRDLIDNRLLIAAAGEVLLKSLLLEGLVGHDHVLSAGVACRAVRVEHLLSSTNVTSEGGAGNAECEGTGDSTSLGSLAKVDLGGLGRLEGSDGGDGNGKDGELHVCGLKNCTRRILTGAGGHPSCTRRSTTRTRFLERRITASFRGTSSDVQAARP
mmetsp:Transcript_34869/g.71267  ORF Transcript_34869/g.71267 Transcript_34869/m.71267 type:complete len:231 (-) Transcript_34869:72-764(-)